MEPVLPASRAMILKMENAYYLILTMLNLQILDVVLGIGTIKFAWIALSDGYLMTRKHAFPFLIFAEHLVKMETVLLATKAITSESVNVSYLIITAPSLEILAVVFGILTSKFAWNALRDGTSTRRISALPFRTNVKLTLRMETVLHAIKAMTWKMANAFFHHQILLLLRT